MTKQSGLGDNLYVDGRNLSGDIGSLSRIGGGPAALEMTGIDKSAIERQGGLRSGSMEFMSFFNPGTDQAHPVLSELPRTDRLVTYFRGTALGSAAAGLNAKQIGYEATRGDNGSLTFSVETQANDFGIEWGEQLTPGVSELTGAANGDGVDFEAGSAFGLQAYLQVLNFTGTSADIDIEHSDDDGIDPYTSVASFASVTAVGAERIQTARNAAVKRWLRVAATGAFTVLDFAVLVVKNQTAVDF